MSTCVTFARSAAIPVMEMSSIQKKSVPSAEISILAVGGVVMNIILNNANFESKYYFDLKYLPEEIVWIKRSGPFFQRDGPLVVASQRFHFSYDSTEQSSIFKQRRRHFQQSGQVDGSVVVDFYQQLGLRAVLDTPSQAHGIFVQQVVVVLEEVSLNMHLILNQMRNSTKNIKINRLPAKCP